MDPRLMEATWTPGAGPTVKIRRLRRSGAGDVIRGTVTKTAVLEYLGAPALTWTVQETGPAGYRTQYHWWLGRANGQKVTWDTGTLTARTVTGKGGNWRAGEGPEVIVDTHIVTAADVDLPAEQLVPTFIHGGGSIVVMDLDGRQIVYYPSRNMWESGVYQVFHGFRLGERKTLAGAIKLAEKRG